jgi:hypothetical protein
LPSEHIRGAPLKPLVYLALGVVALWAISFLIIVSVVGSWEKRAQLGDLFGVANSLFSGLAFAGVIYTIYLQREELSLQRRELQLTREELQRAATAQEKSERVLEKQVEVLEMTARLNALASVVEHYEVLIAGTPVAREKLQVQERQRQFVLRLEQLVQQIERGKAG